MAQFPSTTAADGIWSLKQQRRALLGSAWPVLVTPDPFFANVSLLLHGDGTNGSQNNTFLDSSSNNFTITRNGNTTQGSYSPYGDRWSNKLNGTGDALEFEGIGLSDADFTIECWFYCLGDTGANQALFNQYDGNPAGRWSFSINANNELYFFSNFAVSTVTSNVTWEYNKWNHAAVTRSGSNVYLFLNGALVGTGSASGSLPVSTVKTAIGFGNNVNNVWFNGYISDARIISGTALYTSAFTPPTEPLTAVSGTVLLSCQSNRFKDNSSSNRTALLTGSPEVTPFSPYAPSAAYNPATGGGSGYFDGTTSSLKAPAGSDFAYGTGDFTVEGWFYATSDPVDYGRIIFSQTVSGTNYFLVAAGESVINPAKKLRFTFATSGSGTNITGATDYVLNTWNHFAVVRQSGTVTLYLNGVADGSGACTQDFTNTTYLPTIGQMSHSTTLPFDGYLSDIHVVKGTALYTSNFTPPTAPLSATNDTSLLLSFDNAGIFDSTGKNVLETVGNAQIDTAVTKFGTGSMEFDGTGDLLLIPAPGIELEGDFTIEAWVNRVGVNNTNLDAIFTINTFDEWDEYPAGTTTPGLVVSAGTLHYGIGQVTNYSSTIAADSLWHHIACVRQGSTINVYIDGASVLSVTNSDTYSNVNTPAGIGVFDKVNGTYRNFWNGYIDDLRITKGVARYTANFTPPTKAFPDQ